MKLLLIILASVTGLAIIVEIGLRLTIGLGNPPLYVADREIGYLLAPNQKTRRFGNTIATNQYSMRSRAIEPKSSDRRRILLLGDSVVNGSWWTDQSETLDLLLAGRLQDDSAVETLNASANSWGPRNELAYLERFGLFDADILVLIINTDDLFATQPTSLAVGKSSSYPDRLPALALVELYQLYIAPPQAIPELERLEPLLEKRLEQNLAAITKIKAIAQASDTKFVLVLTPLLRELKSGSTENELAARTAVQELVKTEKIAYIDLLQSWADFPQPEFLYRDRIHPSPQGNTKLVEAIAERIINTRRS